MYTNYRRLKRDFPYGCVVQYKHRVSTVTEHGEENGVFGLFLNHNHEEFIDPTHCVRIHLRKIKVNKIKQNQWANDTLNEDLGQNEIEGDVPLTLPQGITKPRATLDGILGRAPTINRLAEIQRTWAVGLNPTTTLLDTGFPTFQTQAYNANGIIHETRAVPEVRIERQPW